MDWFDLAQDSAKWQALLNMATTSGSKKNVRNFLSYEIPASRDGLCTMELVTFPGNKKKEEAKKDTERMATVTFPRHTQQLHFLRTFIIIPSNATEFY